MAIGKIENTKVSKRLKEIFDKSLERRSDQRKQEKEEKKKNTSGSTSGEHVDLNGPLKGVLGKGDNYARRGYTYLKGLDGRGVYRNFDHPHLDEIRDLVRERAEFPNGPKKNFNPTYTQQYPYAWEAHHMLPGSAFYFEADGKPAFSYRQLRLILQSAYNINHGHNLIMVPNDAWAVPVHTLLQHPGDHRQYTMRVMSDMKEIAADLQRKIDQSEPHDDLTVDVFEALKDLEEEYWDYLVALSRAVVGAIAAGQHFVDDTVRFGTEDDPTAYGWGALA